MTPEKRINELKTRQIGESVLTPTTRCLYCDHYESEHLKKHCYGHDQWGSCRCTKFCNDHNDKRLQ